MVSHPVRSVSRAVPECQCPECTRPRSELWEAAELLIVAVGLVAGLWAGLSLFLVVAGHVH